MCQKNIFCYLNVKWKITFLERDGTFTNFIINWRALSGLLRRIKTTPTIYRAWKKNCVSITQGNAQTGKCKLWDNWKYLVQREKKNAYHFNKKYKQKTM